jgi:hypothetical protein
MSRRASLAASTPPPAPVRPRPAPSARGSRTLVCQRGGLGDGLEWRRRDDYGRYSMHCGRDVLDESLSGID